MTKTASYIRATGSAPIAHQPKKLGPYKPKPFEVWAACPRCAFRVPYGSLKRERLTGLIVCEKCWDPWHPMLSFQARADRSIEPPPEPYPVRWGSAGFSPKDPWNAGGPPAPVISDDARAHNATMTNFTGATAPGVAYSQFPSPSAPIDNYAAVALTPDTRALAQAPVPVGYDGVFVPTSSIVTQQNPNTPNDPYEGLFGAKAGRDLG